MPKEKGRAFRAAPAPGPARRSPFRVPRRRARSAPRTFLQGRREIVIRHAGHAAYRLRVTASDKLISTK
ncbi:hemin uptake protein HemP [Methylobacterium oryzae CBMB20]